MNFCQNAGAGCDQAAKGAKGHAYAAGNALNHAGQCFRACCDNCGKDNAAAIQQASQALAAWADQSGKSVGAAIEDAANHIKAGIEKTNCDTIDDMTHKAAAGIQAAIDGMDKNDFEKWLKRLSEGIGLQALLDDLQAIKTEDLPAQALQYVKDHPGEVALYVVAGTVFFAPVLVYGPLLGMAGFGAGGVAAGGASIV